MVKCVSCSDKVIPAAVAAADGLKTILESSDCLGSISELILSLLPLFPTPPEGVPFDSLTQKQQVWTKVNSSMIGLSGILTFATIISDALSWIIPDENGKRQHQRNGLKVTEKVFWNVAHWIDFVNWLKAVKLIVSESQAFEVLSCACGALKAAASGLSIIGSARTLKKCSGRHEKYQKMQAKWVKLHDYTSGQWNEHAAKKLSYWGAINNSKIELEKNKSEDELEDIFKKDPKFKKCERKINDWSHISRGLRIEGDNFIPALQSYSGSKNATSDRLTKFKKYGEGIKNQKHLVTKEIISIVLCALTIVSVAASIGLAIAGYDISKYVGATAGALGITATVLPIGTNTFDLTNDILELFISKKKLRNPPLPYIDRKKELLWEEEQKKTRQSFSTSLVLVPATASSSSSQGSNVSDIALNQPVESTAVSSKQPFSTDDVIVADAATLASSSSQRSNVSDTAVNHIERNGASSDLTANVSVTAINPVHQKPQVASEAESQQASASELPRSRSESPSSSGSVIVYDVVDGELLPKLERVL